MPHSQCSSPVNGAASGITDMTHASSLPPDDDKLHIKDEVSCDTSSTPRDNIDSDISDGVSPVNKVACDVTSPDDDDDLPSSEVSPANEVISDAKSMTSARNRLRRKPCLANKPLKLLIPEKKNYTSSSKSTLKTTTPTTSKSLPLSCSTYEPSKEPQNVSGSNSPQVPSKNKANNKNQLKSSVANKTTKSSLAKSTKIPVIKSNKTLPSKSVKSATSKSIVKSTSIPHSLPKTKAYKATTRNLPSSLNFVKVGDNKLSSPNKKNAVAPPHLNEDSSDNDGQFLSKVAHLAESDRPNSLPGVLPVKDLTELSDDVTKTARSSEQISSRTCGSTIHSRIPRPSSPLASPPLFPPCMPQSRLLDIETMSPEVWPPGNSDADRDRITSGSYLKQWLDKSSIPLEPQEISSPCVSVSLYHCKW